MIKFVYYLYAKRYRWTRITCIDISKGFLLYYFMFYPRLRSNKIPSEIILNSSKFFLFYGYPKFYFEFIFSYNYNILICGLYFILFCIQ